MYTCGIDVGSSTTKAVILTDEGKVAGRGLKLTRGKAINAATLALNESLLAAGLERSDVALIATTGYGRKLVEFKNSTYTVVTSSSAGARHLFPGTRNVLNVGALRACAIRLDENGHVHRFRLNDLCAGGTGLFLERVAETLEIPLDEIGQLALFSREPRQVPNVCSVLTESEVLNLITLNAKPADILRGVYDALAGRLGALLNQVWLPGQETTLTGGVAKNAGMVSALEQAVGMRLNVGHDAEFASAIGAAVLAKESTPSDPDNMLDQQSPPL
jgi:(R)-2-hydroxyacyl-CoA dehydratese activating ATPase